MLREKKAEETSTLANVTELNVLLKKFTFF